MNSPPTFAPQSPLVPTFVDVLPIGAKPMGVEVFVWEDRLVAHDAGTGLWWATLDTYITGNTRDFWRHCLKNNRVARVFSFQRGFDALRKPNGAMLMCSSRQFDVLVGNDNSGMLRMKGSTIWRPFPAREPRSVNKTGAYRPTIWSPHFQLGYARRSWPSLHGVLQTELAVCLPTVAQRYWQERALPLHLVAMTLALNWAGELNPSLTLQQFWQETLRRRAHAAGSSLFVLPESMRQIPEFSSDGQLYILPHQSFGQIRSGGVIGWKEDDIWLYIPFKMDLYSSHERLEARLELRDWLREFFPRKQVDSWLKA